MTPVEALRSGPPHSQFISRELAFRIIHVDQGWVLRLCVGERLLPYIADRFRIIMLHTEYGDITKAHYVLPEAVGVIIIGTSSNTDIHIVLIRNAWLLEYDLNTHAFLLSRIHNLETLRQARTIMVSTTLCPSLRRLEALGPSA
jgi:hypothetical protein